MGFACQTEILPSFNSVPLAFSRSSLPSSLPVVPLLQTSGWFAVQSLLLHPGMTRTKQKVWAEFCVGGWLSRSVVPLETQHGNKSLGTELKGDPLV